MSQTSASVPQTSALVPQTSASSASLWCRKCLSSVPRMRHKVVWSMSGWIDIPFIGMATTSSCVAPSADFKCTSSPSVFFITKSAAYW